MVENNEIRKEKRAIASLLDGESLATNTWLQVAAFAKSRGILPCYLQKRKFFEAIGERLGEF